jgi:hypothetical protein
MNERLILLSFTEQERLMSAWSESAQSNDSGTKYSFTWDQEILASITGEGGISIMTARRHVVL